MNLATRLREAREAAGYKEPAALAHRIGVKPSALYQLESGKSKSMKGENLIKLADALDVHPRWLLLGKGRRESQPVSITAPIIATTLEVLSAYLRIADLPPTMGRDPEMLAMAFTLVVAAGGTLTEQDRLELAAKLAELNRAKGEWHGGSERENSSGGGD